MPRNVKRPGGAEAVCVCELLPSKVLRRSLERLVVCGSRAECGARQRCRAILGLSMGSLYEIEVLIVTGLGGIEKINLPSTISQL